MKMNWKDFFDMVKAASFRGILPDLKSIRDKGHPRKDCPKWYQEGIEQADLAYQTNEGWKITERGLAILNGETNITR